MDADGAKDMDEEEIVQGFEDVIAGKKRTYPPQFRGLISFQFSFMHSASRSTRWPLPSAPGQRGPAPSPSRRSIPHIPQQLFRELLLCPTGEQFQSYGRGQPGRLLTWRCAGSTPYIGSPYQVIISLRSVLPCMSRCIPGIQNLGASNSSAGSSMEPMS